MFSTTLRIEEDLGDWLRLAARQRALSVNAFLAELIRHEQAQAARRRLASDWGTYALEAEAQDVDYALQAQSDVVAEPKAPGRHKAPAKSRNKVKPGRTR